MTQPTYAELVDLVVSMRAELAALRAENETLKARVAELEAQLRTNSRNSSKGTVALRDRRPSWQEDFRPTGPTELPQRRNQPDRPP
jgi:hypothetical protein